MKTAFLTLLAALVVSIAGVSALAEDKDKEKDKETVYKGELGCPKCVFKLDKKITGGKCGNAIEVTVKDKKTIYVLNDEGGKEEYHKAICTGRKAGQVTAVGAPTKKKDTGDQMYLTPKKDGVKYD